MPVSEDRAYGQTSVAQLADDPRWALVQKIIASKTFGKAYRLGKFLAVPTYRSLRNGSYLPNPLLRRSLRRFPLRYDRLKPSKRKPNPQAEKCVCWYL